MLNALAASDSWTFNKQLSGGTSTASIVKTGSGTITLSPAAGSTFVGSGNGALSINAGTLILGSTFSTAPGASVANGANLGLTGSLPTFPLSALTFGGTSMLSATLSHLSTTSAATPFNVAGGCDDLGQQ